jgi:hypothetical protein
MPNENLAWVRTLKIPGIPQFGSKMYELFSSLQSAVGTVAQQTNTNPAGTPNAPPPVNALHVTASNGHFTAAITDNNEIRRGVGYWLEHADNPHFTNPQIIHLGNARNWHGFLGNYTGYFRASSGYDSSPGNNHAYFGTSVQPTPVTGGGSIPAPQFLLSQGSGTGLPGQRGGPGPTAFRSTSGAPPTS